MDAQVRTILNGYRETALDMAHHLEQVLESIDMKLDDDLRRGRLVAEAFVAEVQKYEEKKQRAAEMKDTTPQPYPHVYKGEGVQGVGA